MRLVIIGSGHVFNLEAALRPRILEERPQVVALELDEQRFRGLLEREAGRVPTEEEKRKAGRVYRYLAGFQESLAKSFGVEPGAEMLVAMKAAREAGAEVALIDRDARGTVKEAIRRMSWGEKFRLLWVGLVASLPGRKKASVEKELERYHRDPTSYLDQVRKEFPTVHKVLIEERNEHMAAELRRIASGASTVVAVVGDGHVDGLVELLRDLNPIVHRLRDLQSPSPPRGATIQASRPDRVSYSFTGQSLEDALRRV